MDTGTRTSEFWITAIVEIALAVVGILAARGLVSPQEGELWITLVRAILTAVIPVVMGQVAVAYTRSRTEVKVAALQAGITVI